MVWRCLDWRHGHLVLDVIYYKIPKTQWKIKSVWLISCLFKKNLTASFSSQLTSRRYFFQTRIPSLRNFLNKKVGNQNNYIMSVLKVDILYLREEIEIWFSCSSSALVLVILRTRTRWTGLESLGYIFLGLKNCKKSMHFLFSGCTTATATSTTTTSPTLFPQSIWTIWYGSIVQSFRGLHRWPMR